MGQSENFIDIFLQPGEYFVGDEMFRIKTLLGSCVSIILWQPQKRIGAMSHFLLSTRNNKQSMSIDGRYGEEAMWIMLKELVRLNVDPGTCIAKIVGGGNMFSNLRNSSLNNVGKKNGQAARELLEIYGIPIHGEHLFGNGHRQVIFQISTGDVWVNQISEAKYH